MNAPCNRIVVALLSSLLLAASAQAQPAKPALNVATRQPDNKAQAVCPDTHLTLTFASPPSYGTAGQVRVYDAADNRLVDTVDIGIPALSQNYTIGGAVGWHYYPVLVNGNTATIYLHNHTLEYNKSYYVQMDSGMLKSDNGDFAGFSGNTSWTFSTKSAPPAANASRLVVAADGTGDFATVQGAVDSIPDKHDERVTIFIHNGVYAEIVYFAHKSNITFLGEDREKVIVGYPNNDRFNSQAGINERPTGSNHYYRASFMGDRSTGIDIVNLTLANSTPHGGSQAEAIIFSGGQNILSHVNLKSFQDTLQINDSAYVDNCYVEGDTDYMWGRGPCFFQDCELKTVSSRSYYTQIRNTQANHGFIYNHCTLDSNPGVTGVYVSRVDASKYPYSEVVLLNCALGTQLNPAGWTISGTTNAPNLHYWEYNSTNISDGQPADVSKRAAFAKQLNKDTDAEAIANYSNPTYVLGWTPTMAPIITVPPTTQTANAGQSANFTVTVAAIPAPTYQWQHNGVALKDGDGVTGATTATLTLDKVRMTDAGNYTVVATNSAGAATSKIVSLKVELPATTRQASEIPIPAVRKVFGQVTTKDASGPVVISSTKAGPTITAQPDSLAVNAGASATFSANVTGLAGLSYEWRLNDKPVADGPGVSGAKTNKLTLSNAQMTHDGVYTLMATDASGSVTSAPAMLAVSAQSLPAQPAGIPSTVFNVTSYKTVGDGVADDTAAIQSAVDAARDNGGGVVLVPPGIYLCRSINLYSKMNFHLASGAVLRLAPFSSYPNGTRTPLINAANATDLQISGHGLIDGQGADWWTAFRSNKNLPRPRLLQISGGSRVIVQDITLTDSPMFHIAFSGRGSNLTAVGVTITAPFSSPNTDGLDPSGTNIYIAHCNISVGDDNIAVKGSSVACGNITVTNCTFGTGHGLSIGGQTNAGVQNMVATHCTFNGTVSAIRMKADPTQGGLTQNISYSDMTMTNVDYPIVIYSYYSKVGNPGVPSGGNFITPTRAAHDNANPPYPLDTRTIPVWRNITFSNITATNTKGYSVLWGLPANLIENVTFNNVQFSGNCGFEIYDAANVQFTGNSTITATNSRPFIVGYPDGDTDATHVTNSLVITSQPASQSVKAGNDVQLTVGVAASPAVTYQWFKNGNAITGATAATLKLTAVQPGDAAKYVVAVANSIGTAMCQPATLTVN